MRRSKNGVGSPMRSADSRRRFPTTGNWSRSRKWVSIWLLGHANSFETLKRAAPGAAPIEVPHPNNRVNLHYQSAERRCEKLSGGVPGWSWLGLKPLLADLDALYINLISGFELDLETAQLIRAAFPRPDLLRHAFAAPRAAARWAANASAARRTRRRGCAASTSSR